jgi:GT2 family glycosyltransferase
MEYEAKFDQIASDHPITALCQYNLDRFKSDSIVDVIHTHPRLIYRGRICDNPYYTPPEEFLGSSRPDIEANRMLETTYDLAAARDGIRKREQRLEVINRVLRHNIRNDINVVRGFLESLQFSEDVEYTRWCKKQGYRVVYCSESVVMHSHNYDPRQAYTRSFGEAWAEAAIRPLHSAEFRRWRTVGLGWVNDTRRDLQFCLRTRRWKEWPHALRIRWHQRLGKLAGFKAGWALSQST